MISLEDSVLLPLEAAFGKFLNILQEGRYPKNLA
jgi:hypothetical protein